jgi:hypothetical protein
MKNSAEKNTVTKKQLTDYFNSLYLSEDRKGDLKAMLKNKFPQYDTVTTDSITHEPIIPEVTEPSAPAARVRSRRFTAAAAVLALVVAGGGVVFAFTNTGISPAANLSAENSSTASQAVNLQQCAEDICTAVLDGESRLESQEGLSFLLYGDTTRTVSYDPETQDFKNAANLYGSNIYDRYYEGDMSRLSDEVCMGVVFAELENTLGKNSEELEELLTMTVTYTISDNGDGFTVTASVTDQYGESAEFSAQSPTYENQET